MLQIARAVQYIHSLGLVHCYLSGVSCTWVCNLVNYLIIEDKQALESGKVLVVFVDDVGQVVRKNRVDAEEVMSLGGMWMHCAYDDLEIWMEGEVGADYVVGGARGPPYSSR